MKQEPEKNKINYYNFPIGLFIIIIFLGIILYLAGTEYLFGIIITLILIKIALSLYQSNSRTKRIFAYVLFPILLFHKFLIPKKLRKEIREIDKKLKNKTVKSI